VDKRQALLENCYLV